MLQRRHAARRFPRPRQQVASPLLAALGRRLWLFRFSLQKAANVALVEDHLGDRGHDRLGRRGGSVRCVTGS